MSKISRKNVEKVNVSMSMIKRNLHFYGQSPNLIENSSNNLGPFSDL